MAAASMLGLLVACGSPGARAGAPPTDEAVAAAIQAIVDSRPPPHRVLELPAVREGVAALYSPDPSPLWTQAGRPRPAARQAVALIERADLQGLSPEDYDAAGLRSRLLELEAATEPQAGDLADLDVALSAGVLRFLEAVHHGRVRPREVGFDYHVDAHGSETAERLRQAVLEGSLEVLVTALEPRLVQYRRLKRALVREREDATATRAGTDRVRKIELAMERLRWLPEVPAGPLLIANVPAFRLVAFRSAADERPVLQMGIVVGRAARTQTPLFVDRLQYVLFRPAWYPPPSIIKNEIVPALKRNPGYLERERMDLVASTDEASPPLPATAENLARLRAGRLWLRQRPGPDNALGLVKFVFPNDYRVYMHDTPARSLFGRKRRDFSHGCIRLERPLDLAELVLSAQPGWTRARIEAALHAARTQRVNVVPPIPVMVFYTTAIVRADGTVEFYDDLYGLDAELEQALRDVVGATD
jgi:murein L,D-transpeptidase YcbB/YkuD